MRVVVNKRENNGVIIYDYSTPNGVIFYEKKFRPIAVKGSVFWDGFRSIVRIAGPSETVRIHSMSHDAKKLSEDWKRVGQSIMDGILAIDEK